MDKLQIASSFLFIDGIKPFFWPSVLHVALLFLDFLFRPPNAQNLLTKIWTKSPISRLVWQIDRICLGLLGGFRGWPIQWNHVKRCKAAHCCHGNKIWPRRGDLDAYRLVLIVFHIVHNVVFVDVDLCLSLQKVKVHSSVIVTPSYADCDCICCFFHAYALFIFWKTLFDNCCV